MEKKRLKSPISRYSAAGLVALVALAIVVFVILRSPEDSWIKDGRGVWIKHGHPSQTPEGVVAQQEAIMKAKEIYSAKKAGGMEFSSQCLGEVGDYAVDIVHVPRTPEDNYVNSQCDEYRFGRLPHFIELDKDGNVVRVV
jgi:hypothetical protein